MASTRSNSKAVSEPKSSEGGQWDWDELYSAIGIRELGETFILIKELADDIAGVGHCLGQNDHAGALNIVSARNYYRDIVDCLNDILRTWDGLESRSHEIFPKARDADTRKEWFKLQEDAFRCAAWQTGRYVQLLVYSMAALDRHFGWERIIRGMHLRELEEETAEVKANLNDIDHHRNPVCFRHARTHWTWKWVKLDEQIDEAKSNRARSQMMGQRRTMAGLRGYQTPRRLPVPTETLPSFREQCHKGNVEPRPNVNLSDILATTTSLRNLRTGGTTAMKATQRGQLAAFETNMLGFTRPKSSATTSKTSRPASTGKPTITHEDILEGSRKRSLGESESQRPTKQAKKNITSNSTSSTSAPAATGTLTDDIEYAHRNFHALQKEPDEGIMSIITRRRREKENQAPENQEETNTSPTTSITPAPAVTPTSANPTGNPYFQDILDDLSKGREKQRAEIIERLRGDKEVQPAAKSVTTIKASTSSATSTPAANVGSNNTLGDDFASMTPEQLEERRREMVRGHEKDHGLEEYEEQPSTKKAETKPTSTSSAFPKVVSTKSLDGYPKRSQSELNKLKKQEDQRKRPTRPPTAQVTTTTKPSPLRHEVLVSPPANDPVAPAARSFLFSSHKPSGTLTPLGFRPDLTQTSNSLAPPTFGGSKTSSKPEPSIRRPENPNKARSHVQRNSNRTNSAPPPQTGNNRISSAPPPHTSNNRSSSTSILKPTTATPTSDSKRVTFQETSNSSGNQTREPNKTPNIPEPIKIEALDATIKVSHLEAVEVYGHDVLATLLAVVPIMEELNDLTHQHPDPNDTIEDRMWELIQALIPLLYILQPAAVAADADKMMEATTKGDKARQAEYMRLMAAIMDFKKEIPNARNRDKRHLRQRAQARQMMLGTDWGWVFIALGLRSDAEEVLRLEKWVEGMRIARGKLDQTDLPWERLSTGSGSEMFPIF